MLRPGTSAAIAIPAAIALSMLLPTAATYTVTYAVDAGGYPVRAYTFFADYDETTLSTCPLIPAPKKCGR